MKCKNIVIGVLFFSLCFAFASVSGAQEKVAGEIIKKEETKPFAEIEPAMNITNIMPTAKNKKNDDDEIEFSADAMESDNANGVIVATGNVDIEYNNMFLKADKVVYDQADDIVTATGNVRFTQANGSVITADYVTASDKMSRAFMEKIKVKMIDGTTIYADSFRKRVNDDKVIEHAMYTPCDFCENVAPLWQINARKVKHDASHQDVNYNDAVLKVKNVPVLYTPYLSHPDPNVKRRSGFLAPTVGKNSYLGGTLQTPYFFDIDPHQDLTVTPIFTTDKDVVMMGNYNKYFYSGEMKIDASYLHDKADDRQENRGHIFTYGRYEINDYWVADADLKYVSDDLYLKEMSLPQKDDAWLVSMARSQMFDNRDYASVEAYYYKLVSYNLQKADRREYYRQNSNKPFVVPLMMYENISESDENGAYFKNSFGFASVYHEDDKNGQRMSMINSWVLPYTSRFGEKYRFVASMKSDMYYINSYRNTYNEEYTGAVARVFPQVGVEWKYPFIRTGENSSHIIEPVVVMAVSPNGGNKENKIPNEDSQEVDLDDSNILNLDRFSGYDRNDTGSRVTYGFNWSSYGKRFGRTTAFIAQSYRFNQNESFSTQMDEKGKFSDYVGRVYASPNEYLDLNYRFRIDKDRLKIKYSELGANIGSSILKFYVSYIYLNSNLYVAENLRERHELYASVSSALSRDWSISIYNRQDLTKKGGTLEHGGSLIYEDECLKFITNVSKYNSDNPDLDDEYSFGFTFYFKTLGGFGA